MTREGLQQLEGAIVETTGCHQEAGAGRKLELPQHATLARPKAGLQEPGRNGWAHVSQLDTADSDWS